MNISTSTFQTSRRRLKQIEEEENATTLQLGHEFQLTQINHQGEEEPLIALNLSETRLLIKEALVGRRRALKKVQKSNIKKRSDARKDDPSVDVDVDEDDDDDDDDDQFMNNETTEKELEALDLLLEQTTTGNNKDLKNTMEYLTNFSRFKDQQTVSAVIQLMKTVDADLHPFEIAQLGSLACDTADEAKTLIPSLNGKISDDVLERILKELSSLASMY
ncbi:DNA-directed RNA polymerase II subunit RPB4 KNAG_0C02610 [Huiozyma naganishii CBS 8797]|uniref:RNA polymerase Rpb4/RPC9 core domain-containing protein n=1 Tax=Huiozyma naganishii (strain ATCC MYA-139 / BCRC 22969 / CBS 8797 / KCTC 17520 / NBRC 10181 / NCYC 3082 / Yp74L-3) TaxID=1071383 RepID=J7RWI6_HUIN7|nr:hypothetical protein KNAG_0C02610 [Kazachstania naganishii CBS 8797]CCK69372.1 hypothetical protein KNAG_0C02610 [Kazachstania naganishii CBS 8797]